MKSRILFSIIFLCTLNGTFAPKREPKIIFPKTATPDDVKSMASVEKNEVLPLVLIQPAQFDTLQPPELMVQLATIDGKTVSGTDFNANSRDKQIFFCASKKKKECLVPEQFKESQLLRCNKNALLSIKPTGRTCGRNYIGVLYKFIYKICAPPKGYDYSAKEFVIYRFCYDINNHKTLYTEHEIMSPLLLDEQLMIREQEVRYDMLTGIYGSEDIDYILHQEALNKVREGRDDFPYVSRGMIPSSDMAFALWKKPTASFINYQLQDIELVKVWDNINDLVRTDATKMHFNIPYYIHTGVFKLHEDTPQLKDVIYPSIWVKMITVTFKTGRRHGTAIIMDNFKQPKSTSDQATSSDVKKEPPKGRFCEDMCDDDIAAKFAELGGRVNCCPISDEIQELFGTELIINGVLRIADLIKS